MLDEIEIKNFRGIREGTVRGFGAVNVVVGPNGSGKSSLLEAIYLGSLVSNKSWIPGKSPREIVAERHNEKEFDLKNLVYSKTPGPVTVTYLVDGNMGKLEVSRRTPRMTGGNQVAAFFSDAKLFDVRHLLDKALELALWDAVLTNRADRVLKAIMNEVYGLEVENFSYSPQDQVLKVLFSDRDFALNVDDLGAGMRVALRVFMAAALTKHTLLIIEEFDAYQHVDIMPKFARALVKIAHENDTQLFLATHSEETITRFVEAVEEVGVELKLIQTKLSTDGVLETATLEASRASRLLDAGIDVRRAG